MATCRLTGALLLTDTASIMVSVTSVQVMHQYVTGRVKPSSLFAFQIARALYSQSAVVAGCIHYCLEILETIGTWMEGSRVRL